MKYKLLIAVGGIFWSNLNACSQDTLRGRDVYNMEVGDVFQFLYDSSRNYEIKRRIVTKQLDIGNDNVKFGVVDSVYWITKMDIRFVRVEMKDLIYENLSIIIFPIQDTSYYLQDTFTFCGEVAYVLKKDIDSGFIRTTYHRHFGSYTYYFNSINLKGYLEKLDYAKTKTKECGYKIIPLNLYKEVNKADFSIFPNPAKDIIHFNADFIKTTYTINNVIGQEMIKGMLNGSQLDVTLLLPGIYFLNIYHDQNILRTTFVKE